MNYKQKIPLICFVVLTVIVSLAMAVLDIQTYISYLDANEAIKIYQQEIIDNSKKEPSYNDENRKALQKYSEKIKSIVLQFKQQHGKPHRKALNEFAKAVGSTEEQLLKRFADYYNALPDEKKGIFTDKKDKAIWEGFMKLLYCPKADDKQFDPETMTYLGTSDKVTEDHAKAYDAKKKEKYLADRKKVEDAFAKFAEYSKQYAEYQIPSTQYKCFLDALGLPVTGELSDLNDLLINQKYWTDLIPGLKERLTAKESNNKSNTDAEKLMKSLIISMDLGSWNEDQLSLIYLQLQIKQDLYKRMKQSKITKVHSVLLETNGAAANNDSFFPGAAGKTPAADPLKGNPVLGNSFVVYTYRIKLSGTLESIRQLLDSLNDAYKDYRTYNVRDLVLTRELATEKFPDVLTQKDTSSRREGQEVPDSYGSVVIGRDLNAECEILVDYVIYVQDLLVALWFEAFPHMLLYAGLSITSSLSSLSIEILFPGNQSYIHIQANPSIQCNHHTVAMPPSHLALPRYLLPRNPILFQSSD